MAEEQKNRLTEAVETGASTAQAIHGAIKTGKAVSAAAKGAAIGGPYGAAVGAVLAGRRHIGKIIAVIAIVVMLPVLFVLMLPGLLFGGLTGSGASGTEGFPVLNNEQAVIENANNITFSINQLLNEGLDDVLARIDADFAASDGEEMEIHNPYATAPVYNANLFISQYCAARSLDFRTISLSDMEAVLRRNKSYFYSFTRKEELRDREETDPDTNEKSTVTEKWMIYTISYNGEAHFADNVFQLTDEQKELAADYAANLSLFLGDGMLQNLTAWNGNSIPSLGISGLRTAGPLLSILTRWTSDTRINHMARTISAVMAVAPALWRLWFLRLPGKPLILWKWRIGPIKTGTGARAAAPTTRSFRERLKPGDFLFPAAALRNRSGLLTPCQRGSW